MATTTAFLFGKKMTYEQFIDAWGKETIKRYEKEKVLPSLPICQAILESGWGTTQISKTLFNYHGMNWYGDSVTKIYEHETRITKQERNGVLVESREEFAKFHTLNEELDCYYKWLNRNKPAYKAIHGNKDALENFKLIKEAGYATSSQYTQSLTRIYNQYPQIKAFDDKVLNPVVPATPAPSPKYKHYWFVNVGSFINEVYAKNLKTSLAKQGIDTIIKHEGSYYKVQAGAYESEINAMKRSQELKAMGIDNFVYDGNIPIN